MLLILQHENKAKLAIYHTKLMQTDWLNTENLSIELKGLNLDTVWENIIVQVGGITIEQGNSLDEQIEINEKKLKLRKEIDILERQARKEKQPKKKFELVQKINKIKNDLEGLYVRKQ